MDAMLSVVTSGGLPLSSFIQKYLLFFFFNGVSVLITFEMKKKRKLKRSPNLEQGLANYGLWARSSPQSVFVQRRMVFTFLKGRKNNTQRRICS